MAGVSQMQEQFAAPAMDGGCVANAGAICERPPWMASVSQMQEQFAASRTLRYVNPVTPFTGPTETGDDTVKQVSEILLLTVSP
jgi:hypothetical protein